MIYIETDRLVLRNVRPEDLETIFDYRNHPVCAQYQRGQTKDYDGIAQLLAAHKLDTIRMDSPAMLAVALRECGELIGEIVVMPNENTFALGYTFSYKHHRKGYANEAAFMQQKPD